MNQCKRLSDCPADRLAQCRGEAVPPAGDVEVFSMKYGERPTEGDGQLIRHADHLAVVTRLTAERDGLKSSEELLRAELAWSENDCRDLMKERDGLLADVNALTEHRDELKMQRDRWVRMHNNLQSELTKARELLSANATDFEGIRRALASFHKENQEQWCGYLDDSLGICLFRIKEMAAYLAIPIAHNADESCGQDAEAAKGGESIGAKCWSCKQPVTLMEWVETDGQCPHCDAEIDEAEGLKP